MRQTPLVLLLAAVVLLVLTGGCSRGDDAAEPRAAPPQPTPIGQPTPSPEPAERRTPGQLEAPPELHFVGDDYERILAQPLRLPNMAVPPP